MFQKLFSFVFFLLIYYSAFVFSRYFVFLYFDFVLISKRKIKQLSNANDMFDDSVYTFMRYGMNEPRSFQIENFTNVEKRRFKQKIIIEYVKIICVK